MLSEGAESSLFWVKVSLTLGRDEISCVLPDSPLEDDCLTLSEKVFGSCDCLFLLTNS